MDALLCSSLGERYANTTTQDIVIKGKIYHEVCYAYPFKNKEIFCIVSLERYSEKLLSDIRDCL